MVRARRLTIVAGAVIALWSVVGVVAAAGSDARNEPSEQDFASRVNAARSEAGRAHLVVRADLVEVARRHSARMARERRLYHSPSLGDDVSGWDALGENVGTGSDVGAVHDAFMASSVHRNDILDARFTEMGVGVVWDGSTLWVTEVFRQPSASAAPPAPAPPPPPPPSDPAPAPAPRQPQAQQPAPPPPPPAPAPPAPSPSLMPSPAVPPAAPAPTSGPAAAAAVAHPPTQSHSAASIASETATVWEDAIAGVEPVAVLGARHEQALAVPANIPRVPAPVGVAAALLSLVVAAQGAVVRRLGLA